MIDKPALIALGVMAGVAFLTLLSLLPPIEPDIENSPNFKDLIPEPDPNDLQAHVAYCMTPWGQLTAVFFSPEQWQMLHQAAKMSDQSLDEMICEIAQERHELRDNPPDPPF